MANTYNGSAYNAKIVETPVSGGQFSIVCTFDTIPNATASLFKYTTDGVTWVSNAGSPISPRTLNVPDTVTAYEVEIFFTGGLPPVTITFIKVVQSGVDNYIFSPKLNPWVFYADDRATSAVYQTPHFEQFQFTERGKPWLQAGRYRRIWQTTEIIRGQFQATFDPVIVELVNEYDYPVISLPALAGLPNRYNPDTYLFEYSMSLAGLETGCYRGKRTLGSGEGQKIEYTDWQFISSEPIPNTLLIAYKNSRYFKDIIFETGIEFMIRVPGWIDYDKIKPVKKEEVYRNQKFTKEILSNKSTDTFPVHFGCEAGLPSDLTQLIEDIFMCDITAIDDRSMGLSEGKSFEYEDVEGYRQRGMTGLFEPGVTRDSRVSFINQNPNKKLIITSVVDSAVFGDLSNQGSSNEIPINIVI